MPFAIIIDILHH